jgi:hypothetical protein
MKTAKQLLTVAQRRYVSVARVHSMANQFATFASRCCDGNKLKSTFTSYRAAMIESLMAPYDWNTYRADVLEMESSGHFRLADTSHGSSHLELPYDMRLSFDEITRKILKPGSHAGLAPYCCWAALTAQQPGFGILDLTVEETPFRYYQERSPENFREFLQFVEENVASVYRSPPQGAKPTYEGILSAAIVGIEASDDAPEKHHERFCHGSVHIVCEKGCPFELDDGLWLLACTPGFASLYRSFGKAKLALSPEYIKSLPPTVPADIHAELSDAAKCLQGNLYNAYSITLRRLLEHICMEEGRKRNIADPLIKYRKREEKPSEVIDRLVKAGLPSYVAEHLQDLISFGNSAAHIDTAGLKADWAALSWENVEWIVDELYGARKQARPPRDR